MKMYGTGMSPESCCSSVSITGRSIRRVCVSVARRPDSRTGQVKFYGAQRTEFFPSFYSQMDLILAPNIPFTLLPGAFDGFPPGGCIEAGLSGVAVFCTDVLNQNIAFKDGEELVIVFADQAPEGWTR